MRKGGAFDRMGTETTWCCYPCRVWTTAAARGRGVRNRTGKRLVSHRKPRQQLPAGFTGRIEPGDGSLYVIPNDLTDGLFIDHQYDQSVVEALGPEGELTWRVYQDGVVQPIQDEKVTVAQITAPAPTPTHTAVQPSATLTHTPTREMPSATLTITSSTTSTSTGGTVGPTVTNTALSGTPTGTPTGDPDPDPGATHVSATQTAVAATSSAETAIAGTAISLTQTAALPLVLPDTFLPLVMSEAAPAPTPVPAPGPVQE